MASASFSLSRLFWLFCRLFLDAKSSPVPSNSRAMNAIPSRRIYDFPAKKYSTGLAQLLMKAIEDVTARLLCQISSNLNEIKKVQF